MKSLGLWVFFLWAEFSFANQWLDGVDYSAYRSGQRPGGSDFPTKEQIREDLRLLKTFARSIRLYAMAEPTPTILEVCAEESMPVHLSAWLGREPAARAANRRELDLLQSTAIALSQGPDKGLIKSLIVGSEVLYRGDLSEAGLIAYLSELKIGVEATGIPVSSALIYTELSPALVQAMDIVMIHAYPFWEGYAINEASTRIAASFAASQAKLSAWGFSAKEIIIGETGWASGGGAFGAAQASEKNQWSYLRDLLAWQTGDGTHKGPQIFFFSGFDEEWKAGAEGTLGVHWGLYDSARRPKLALKCLRALSPLADCL